jgi:hypothetical protein
MRGMRGKNNCLLTSPAPSSPPTPSSHLCLGATGACDAGGLEILGLMPC